MDRALGACGSRLVDEGGRGQRRRSDAAVGDPAGAQTGRGDDAGGRVVDRDAAAAQAGGHLDEVHEHLSEMARVGCLGASGRRGAGGDPTVGVGQLRTHAPKGVEGLAVGHIGMGGQRADVVRRLGECVDVDEGQQVEGGLGGLRRGQLLDLLDAVDGRTDGSLQELGEDLVLAGEVVVERRLPDPDLLGDLPGGGGRESFGDEQLRSGMKDLLAWRGCRARWDEAWSSGLGSSGAHPRPCLPVDADPDSS